MNRKKLMLVISVLIIILVIVIIITNPRDIVNKGSDTIRIIQAEFNTEYGLENVECVDISDRGDEIIDIMSRYKERPSFVVAKGYNLSDVEFRITLDCGDGVKEIILGVENYSNMGRGKLKYTIINAEDLAGELRKLAN